MLRDIRTAALATAMVAAASLAAFAETTVLRGSPPNRTSTSNPNDADPNAAGGAAGGLDQSVNPGPARTGDANTGGEIAAPTPGGAGSTGTRPSGKLVSPEVTQPGAAR
jgi:hypothetical protein